MYIDTHCHINSDELRNDAITVITRARDAGVKKLVIVGCDFEDSCEALAMAEDFPQFGLYATVGIHPHEARRYDDVPPEFNILIENWRTVAIGEIGLDYHYNYSPKQDQRKMFELQLDFAHEHDMPVILHIREAMSDAMNILKDHKGMKLLFHCYSGGMEYLEEVLSLHGLCAFGGAITWPSVKYDGLREVVRHIPLENILAETDSPYMSPVPFRGSLNEPANIVKVYEAIAQERRMSVPEIEAIIESNADRFFAWSDKCSSSK